MKTNASLSAPTSSRADTAQPAIATQPRTATTNLLVVMVLACLLFAGCNSKNTNMGGASDQSTTQTDSSDQSNTRNGDDDGQMGPGSNGPGMMGDDKDTTRNSTHRKGMNHKPGPGGMMNR
jgi:hypothetical protein